MKKYLLDSFFLLVIILSSFLITRPLFNRGYFATQDGEWAIIRLAEMKREIKDHQIPPRWSGYLNHQYGYPLFNFVYPFPYYVGLIPNSIGFNLTDSIKLLFIGSVFLSGIGMYVLGKYLKSAWMGIIASLIYISAPYRIANIYVRGSLGEMISGGIFPFVVLFSIVFIRTGRIRFYILSSTFLFFLLLSHNVSALFFLPILVLIFLIEIFRVKIKQIEYIKKSLYILISGFGLASYFILPALLEKKYIVLSKVPLTHISNYFLNISSLIGITVGKSGPFLPIRIFSLIVFFSLMILFIIYHVKYKKKIDKKKIFPIFLLFIMLCVYVFMMLPQSRIFWNLPLVSSVDFPWRLLGPVSFLVSFILIYVTEQKYIKVSLIFLACISLVTILPNVKINTFFEKNDSYYYSNDATTTSADELMPVWVKVKPTEWHGRRTELLEGLTQKSIWGGEGSDPMIIQKGGSNYLKAIGDMTMNSIIQINTLYYPGWEYKINGKVVKPEIDTTYGTVSFSLPPGHNVIEAEFKETNLRLFSDILTILFIGIIFILVPGYQGLFLKKKK